MVPYMITFSSKINILNIKIVIYRICVNVHTIWLCSYNTGRISRYIGRKLLETKIPNTNIIIRITGRTRFWGLN